MMYTRVFDFLSVPLKLRHQTSSDHNHTLRCYRVNCFPIKDGGPDRIRTSDLLPFHGVQGFMCGYGNKGLFTIFIRRSYILLPPKVKHSFWRIRMDLKEVMAKDVVTVQPNATVKAAVELMNQHEIGCIVVKDEEKPIAIVTERDVLAKIVCQCKNPEQVMVSEIMSQPLLVGKVGMSLEEAVKFMFIQNIKKLPIVDDGKLVGLITLTDIALAPWCPHRFGYLASRPKNNSIPKECLICPKVVHCVRPHS